VRYKYDDGTIDKLSVRMPELFSLGLQESKLFHHKQDTYTFPIVMYDARVSPTEEEQNCIDMFDSIQKVIVLYLKSPEMKPLMNKYNMDSRVDQMNIFYRKKTKEGRIIEEAAPVLHPKLFMDLTKSSVFPGFYDPDDIPINPSDIIGKRCKCICDIIIDSVYVGPRPSIHLKLNDAIITELYDKKRVLHAPPKIST
jgi:hypothetical protein